VMFRVMVWLNVIAVLCAISRIWLPDALEKRLITPTTRT